MSGYWSWVLKRSVRVLLLLGAAGALLLPVLDDLEIDTSPSTLILSDSPANLIHQKTGRIFGNDEVLLIGLTADSLLQPDTLASIRQVTRDIEAIPGVRRVLSLANTLDILERDDAVEISPLIPESLEQADLQQLRARLRDNPLYEKELISSDLRTTSLLVFLEDRSSRGEDQIFRLVADIRTAAAPLARLGRLFFGGVPEMETAGMRNMIRDLWVFTPITVVLVMAILILNFHSLRGVALPLLAIGLTLVCTLAAMVLGGFPLKPTTLVLPSLLIANGSAYTIHLLTHYYQCLLQAYDRIASDQQGRLTRQQYRQVLAQSLDRAHRPIATSAFTTMAGFAALIFNRIPAIRDLGLFAVLGVFLSYLFCMHLIPAILVHLRVPPRRRIPGHDRSHRQAFFQKLGHFNLEYRGWIYSMAGLCAVLGLAGAFQVQVRHRLPGTLSGFGPGGAGHPILRGASFRAVRLFHRDREPRPVAPDRPGHPERRGSAPAEIAGSARRGSKPLHRGQREASEPGLSSEPAGLLPSSRQAGPPGRNGGADRIRSPRTEPRIPLRGPRDSAHSGAVFAVRIHPVAGAHRPGRATGRPLAPPDRATAKPPARWC